MEKQISIIIPTYNMEAYIGKCLDSLLIPEFDQVEVFVVNDGSKDRSSEIAHSYADRYPDSIRVIDKPNGNYGSCINAALPLATGRYVKVLDADDTFDTAAFSEFVRLLPGIDCDAIVTEYVSTNPDGSIIRHECRGFGEYTYGKEIDVNLELIESQLNYIPMHRLSYRRDIFNRFEYKQKEGVSYSDSQWAIIPLSYCHKVMFINLVVYRYLLGRDGQTMASEQIAKSMNSFFAVLSDSLDKMAKIVDVQSKSMACKMLLTQHEYIYNLAYQNLNDSIASLWRNYDAELLKKSPEIYLELSKIPYSKQFSSFSLFKDIRKKSFPSGYRLPMYIRVLIFVKHRLFC